MKLEAVILVPKYRISVSKDELAVLLEASRRHYDSACRSLSHPGGFLSGLQNLNAHVPGAALEWDCTRREIDTLAKVLEMESIRDPGAIGALLWIGNLLRYGNPGEEITDDRVANMAGLQSRECQWAKGE